MVRALILLALMSCPAAAVADDLQDMVDGLRGQYGSDQNPDYACTDNPVTLDFMAAPPHAIFSWDFPTDTINGPNRTREVYDLIGPTQGGLLMRLEGEPRTTASGATPIWILRPYPGFAGFCWGRTDWSVLQCVTPHHRCQTDVPSS